MNTLFARTPVIVRKSLRRFALVNPQLPGGLAEKLWKTPGALVEMSDPLQSKGARKTVCLRWDGQPYVLKHYVEPGYGHALKRTILPSRARTTWNVMHRLADAGVATPRPVACIEDRFGVLRRDSFLLYPYQEGRTLRSCLAAAGCSDSPPLEPLWNQIYELWRRLAQLRASLADANLGNFIVSPAGRLWVIDLDKARFHRLAFTAARYQERAWQQLLRSAAKAACLGQPALVKK